MKILSLLDEITHVYQIIIASGSAPSLRQWFRTLLEASIFSMYANTVINIHVGNSEHYDLFQGKRTMKAKRWQYGYNLIVATFDKYSFYCY